MSMHPKEKELVAVAISVAAGCRPCTDHHVKVARKARATDGEIRQVIDQAIDVRRRAADVMAAYALAHLDIDHEARGDAIPTGLDRTISMIGVGAAFAVNCVSSLEQYLAAAKNAGVVDDEISQIAKLAVFIKQKAASHVERLVDLPEEEVA